MLRYVFDSDDVFQVRQYINAQRCESLKNLCLGSEHAHAQCKKAINEAEPEFGITPLHLARAAGDEKSAMLLESLGADKERFDSAGRKPQNLSFASFIANSKKWQRKIPGCHFPSVHLVEDENSLVEIRRLVGEGEPILIRGVIDFLKITTKVNMEMFVEENANISVTVGKVPYASYFGLPYSQSTLREYFDNHVQNRNNGISDGSEGEDEADGPLYVFQKSDSATALGLEILSKLLRVKIGKIFLLYVFFFSFFFLRNFFFYS